MSRADLTRILYGYLAALVEHNPSRVRFASDARFFEQAVKTKIGEGLWKTATAIPTTFKISVIDTAAQQVGCIAMMEENGKPIEVAIRLKLIGGRITEAEHLIARNLSERSLANLQTPRTAFSAIVPPAQRDNRDRMLTIGASYYVALTTSNGKATPFADDCLRRENGMQTTGLLRPRRREALRRPALSAVPRSSIPEP